MIISNMAVVTLLFGKINLSWIQPKILFSSLLSMYFYEYVIASTWTPLFLWAPM